MRLIPAGQESVAAGHVIHSVLGLTRVFWASFDVLGYSRRWGERLRGRFKSLPRATCYATYLLRAHSLLCLCYLCVNWWGPPSEFLLQSNSTGDRSHLKENWIDTFRACHLKFWRSQTVLVYAELCSVFHVFLFSLTRSMQILVGKDSSWLYFELPHPSKSPTLQKLSTTLWKQRDVNSNSYG